MLDVTVLEFGLHFRGTILCSTLLTCMYLASTFAPRCQRLWYVSVCASGMS